MKKMLNLSIAIYLISVSVGLANPWHTTDEEKNAINVLNAFIDAMFEGNTETIKQSIGGNLLEKRKKLLDHPGYSASLRDAYKDASFEILNCKSLKKDSIQIDVKIDLNEYESKQLRFLLIQKAISPDSQPQFRIHSQTEMTK
jgi:hypothetical protein